MSISVLNSSALAMMSQSHAMGQISTNIANVNTSGYKSSETLFKTQMVAESNGYDIYSATTADRRAVDLAGTTVVTGSVFDLTISGEGFFTVSNSFDEVNGVNQFYTRAGDFATVPVVEGDETNAYLTTQSGHYVLGWNADRATGEFSNTLEPIMVTPLEYIDGLPTSEMEVRANISSDNSSAQNLDLPVYDNNFKAQGLTMRFEPVEGEIANQWTMSAVIDNGTVTSAPITVRFDDLGNMIEPANGNVNLNIVWDDGTASNVSMDMSETTQLGSEKTILYDLEQDGMESGQLASVSWDDNGVLYGTYTNTRSIPIAKVAISTFTAASNLKSVSGTLFERTPAAGELRISDLSSDDLISTSIQSETYEASNVDLSGEFSRMITTQKAYSSASTAFQTGDEMLQTVIGLKA